MPLFSARTNDEQGEPVPIRRRVFSLPSLSSLLLAGAFLFFLVTRFDVDPKAAWADVRDSNPWYLVLAVLVHYMTFLFRGARWRMLLRNAQEDESAVPGVM
ncbi:MAG: flippase-like domain-containing protein [Dehalococcoidia bacterium]|nr:flippase-like domain-containing protein [Dehalococcoidia bacterium]